jgi:hypothetical protein
MLIDTEQVDRRQVAMALLKNGGMDFIDKPAEEVWPDESTRADKAQWREGLITQKVRELDTLFTALEQAMPS